MLKSIRKSKRLTQEKLASQSGISRITIARIESGARKPRVDTAARLADALGCTIDELVRKEEKA